MKFNEPILYLQMVSAAQMKNRQLLSMVSFSEPTMQPAQRRTAEIRGGGEVPADRHPLARTPGGEEARGGQAKQTFEIEVASIRAQLKSHRKWIVHPREHKWTKYWDTCSLSCVLFTALVTPFEVGITSPVPIWEFSAAQYPLFVINRMVDTFFLADMVLSFFMAYQMPAHKGGGWVIDRYQIVWHYLCSWFPLDFISVLPFDLFLSLGLFEGAGGPNGTLARTLRLASSAPTDPCTAVCVLCVVSR